MIVNNRNHYRRLITGLVLSVLMLTVTSCSPQAKTFGSPIDEKRGVPVTLEQIFADLSFFEGKNLIVKGKSGQVCQTSGCWVMLTDGPNQLFVQFYNFTVRPPVGSTLRVQGILKTQNQVPFLAGEGLEIL